MRTTLAGAFAGMVLSLMLCVNGFGQEIRQGPLTDAIKKDDEPKTKEALGKLEEIRQTVIAAKPGADLWQTGRQAYPHLQVLADNWKDPRSEEILRQLANSGPKKIEGELEMQTLAFAADRYLMQLQDNREYDGLLKGIDKSDDRVKKIREYFDAHPDLLTTKCYGRPNRPIAKMLLDEAEKLKGAEVIDLLARSQLYATGHFTQYKDALLDYAKRLGREKAVAMPYLLQYIVATKNADLVPVLEQWLKEETREKESLEMASCLTSFPTGQRVLLALLDDSRPCLVKYASLRLKTSNPKEVANAVQRTIKKLEEKKADEKEISQFRSLLGAVRDGGKE